jgi:hypothetical protein
LSVVVNQILFLRSWEKGVEVFIREIYGEVPNVRFVEIPVKRVINSKGEDLKNVQTELLILNYPPTTN